MAKQQTAADALSHVSPPQDPHAQPAAAVLKQLRVSSEEGLNESEVELRWRQFGPNTITSRRATTMLHLLLHQFQSPVVYLLGAASVLALYFGEMEEGIAIVAVLAINALIGFVTEFKAARSIESLRALGGRTARVRRERHVRIIPAEELVPGDIVLLDAGDAVSADLRLIETSGLTADESTLTGESVAVNKATELVSHDARLGDRFCMLFKGTAVTRGSGIGVVTATGLSTELGQITELVLEADSGISPLERKLTRLSAQLVWATLMIATAIAVIGLAYGQDSFLIIEGAIALAVAAIPEGLPIVATLALARGMWRMAERNALIERLSAVETLGATTVILTDKTGTLTENRMTVRLLDTPSGEINVGTNANDDANVVDDRQAQLLLRIAVLCNDAHLDTPEDHGSGDPMEIALLRAGLLAHLARTELLQDYPVAHKYSFDPATKMMATVHKRDDGFMIAVKGAPEAVLAATTHVINDSSDDTLDTSARVAWLARADHLGHHGLRVLACAMKQTSQANTPPFERLTLVGLIGLEDPARADVPHAIADCRRAGIRVVMVTGDHAVTARSIGVAVGLADHTSQVADGKTITDVLTAGPAALGKVSIFSRVSPAEKLALVRAYQTAGDIVAMTGDGVNDAPALRQADIGVAMGLRGTDVAREAAAMILLDDAFPTIVNAISQGRIIFNNIRRFVAYLLSCNLSEVMVVGLAVAWGLPLPLLPLQILYLNLITDVFPAFALAMGEGEPDILERPPRNPKEPILGQKQWLLIALHGAALTCGTFLAVAAANWLVFDTRTTVTVTFLTLAFAQLWHAFNMRSLRASIVVNEVTRNGWLWIALALCTVLLAVPPYLPPAAQVLHLAPVTTTMWAVVLICSLTPFIVTQIFMLAASLVYARRR